MSVDSDVRWSRTEGYEISSQGDKRFSAFNAIMYDGRSIEMHYQCDVKGMDPGGINWRLGKGKPSLIPNTDLYHEYLDLWKCWSVNNLELLRELDIQAYNHNNCLRDRFASTPVNQAHALADILTILRKRKHEHQV
jgi:hypothetical protein